MDVSSMDNNDDDDVDREIEQWFRSLENDFTFLDFEKVASPPSSSSSSASSSSASSSSSAYIPPILHTKKHVHIEVNIKTLGDLILLIEEQKPQYNPCNEYNIGIGRLIAIETELRVLDAMIGMKKVKESIVDHILYFLQDLHKDKNGVSTDYKHMVLAGPPGVGKTELAKIIARLFLNMGVLRNNIFKKATRSDMVGGFLGQTAIKTTALVQSCLGGVLFIDEAYSLWDPSKEKQDSYAREAVDTLCEAMSFHREDLMVIIAGYQTEIDSFLEVNRGLESRFLWRYNIEPYTSDELKDIFVKKVRDEGWEIQEQEAEGKGKEGKGKGKEGKGNGKQEKEIGKGSPLGAWFEKRKKDFESSGRDIEKLFTFAKTAHSRRIFGKAMTDSQQKKNLTEEDLELGHKQFLTNRKKKKEEPNTHQFYYV